jgi:His/Glu/Gln/Arg/opine family amino acid ABC transporter permease subunit
LRAGRPIYPIVAAAVLAAIASFRVAPSERLAAFSGYMLFMLPGAVNTLILFLGASGIGLGLGFLAGWGRSSGHPIASIPSTLYIETFRGIPRIVIVLMALVIFPIIGGLTRSLNWLADIDNAIIWGIVALGISSGAYQAEVFRSGFQSIASGQVEAARSLGMNYWQVMRYIILPQVVRTVLPPLGNEWIIVLKDTSLLYLLPGTVVRIPGVLELTARANFLRTTTYDPLMWPLIFLGAALIYLVLTSIMSRVIHFVEESYKVPGLGVQST